MGLSRVFKTPCSGRLFKNAQMQGAQEPKSEAYIEIRRAMRFAAQRRRRAFFNSLFRSSIRDMNIPASPAQGAERSGATPEKNLHLRQRAERNCIFGDMAL